jgi:aspartyl-tRNA(Asn)/glutamyl-tRNA(Gln) amidotransferase subunit B
MDGSGRAAADVVEREGLGQIDDHAAVEAAVLEVLAANPGPAAQYRAGRTQTFGFLVGQVMKATRGKAKPTLVNDLMRRALESPEGTR